MCAGDAAGGVRKGTGLVCSWDKRDSRVDVGCWTRQGYEDLTELEVDRHSCQGGIVEKEEECWKKKEMTG